MTLETAAKVSGVSKPTLKKYFEIEMTGGQFPDTLFDSKEEKEKE